MIAAVDAEKQYQPGAKTIFADYKRADAFLIATAKHLGMIIITHEKSSPEARARVPLPNASALIGVQTITIFEMLSKHAQTPNFKFKSCPYRLTDAAEADLAEVWAYLAVTP